MSVGRPESYSLGLSGQISHYSPRIVSEEDSNNSLLKFLYAQKTIDEETLAQGAAQWPKATKMVIEPTSDTAVKLAPNFLPKLTSLFPRIQELTLKNFEHHWFDFQLDNKAFVDSLPNLSELKLIKLDSCRTLTAESIALLFKTCPKLQRVDIASDLWTNDLLKAALQLKTLTHLNVSGENEIDDEGLQILSEEGGRLTELGLLIYSREGREPFTLAAAKTLAASLTQLQAFSCKGCELDGAFVKELTTRNKQLRELILLSPVHTEETAEEIKKRIPHCHFIAFGGEVL